MLEDEPAFDFVGFSLDVPERVIRQSLVLSQVPELLVSGILARAHTIKKCARPAAHVQADLLYFRNLAMERKLPVHNPAFPKILEQVTLPILAVH